MYRKHIVAYLKKSFILSTYFLLKQLYVLFTLINSYRSSYHIVILFIKILRYDYQKIKIYDIFNISCQYLYQNKIKI